MPEQHFLGKVALKAVIVKDGKALITRDDRNVWEIPGGRLNLDEEIEDALKREIKEELGVEAVIGRLLYTEQFLLTRDGALHLLLAFEVTLRDPEAPFQPSSKEVEELRWVTSEELKKLEMYGNCKNALLAYWGV